MNNNIAYGTSALTVPPPSDDVWQSENEAQPRPSSEDAFINSVYAAGMTVIAAILIISALVIK